MKFYRLLPEDVVETNDIFCCAVEDYETRYGLTDSYMMTKGKYIQEWRTDFTFEFDPNEGKNATDFMTNDLAWVIVSERIRQVLESLEIDNAQYLPIVIRDKQSGTTLDGYSVLNVTNLTDALDLGQSRVHELKASGKVVRLMSKFALKEDAIVGKHVLRLLGYTTPLFISEVAVDELRRISATGCDFAEVRMV